MVEPSLHGIVILQMTAEVNFIFVSRESVEKVLVETLRDRWQILVNGSPAPNHDDGNFNATLNDLDLESLKLILSIKSEQEDFSDFSFSFNQGNYNSANSRIEMWLEINRRSQLS